MSEIETNFKWLKTKTAFMLELPHNSGQYCFKANNSHELKKVSRICILVATINSDLILQLITPTMINWGWGHTDPSNYIILNRTNMQVTPLGCEHREKYVKSYVERNANIFYRDKRSGFAKTFERDICCICLENTANVYGFCNTNHLIGCSKCCKNIAKCPICLNDIKHFIQVEDHVPDKIYI